MSLEAIAPSAAALLDWYDRHRRTLPWRAEPGETPDPYRVWLSEIMLQQTTVAAVIPHYRRFVSRFPTVRDLAAAPVEDVMAAWAGLGYYARARNLHACARIVAGTGMPADPDALTGLPGIGRYTATAIAAIAFDVPGVPVDGNVERVVARVFAVTETLPGAKPALRDAAERLGGAPEARERPSDFAQALFDLGATVCTPASPGCVVCPWVRACEGVRRGIAAELPRRAPARERPVRYGVHFWLQDEAGRVLLRRRAASGLLGGMLELPGTDWRGEPWGEDAMGAAPAIASWRRMGEVRHGFTHFELRIQLYAACVPRIDTDRGLYSPAEIAEEAIPSVMRKCLRLVEARG